MKEGSSNAPIKMERIDIILPVNHHELCMIVLEDKTRLNLRLQNDFQEFTITQKLRLDLR
jgi:hypothetical protein